MLGLSLAAASGLIAKTAAQTGAIEGQVTYEGEVPAPTIVMEGGGAQQVLYVGNGGALRFAVAYVELPTDDRAPKEPATLNQVGFIFQPPVLSVRAGQAVRFTNEDGANHTVRSHHTDPSNRFNIYTGAGQEGTHRFKATGAAPAVITCDIHPWMIAWIYAFDHGYFAVSDEAGRFRIPGLPPGRHQLAVRQPAGGLRRDLSVRVAAGEVSRVKVRLAATDMKAPARPETTHAPHALVGSSAVATSRGCRYEAAGRAREVAAGH
jgi:plastocyanin